jgi:AraC-like DNA-binding protein
MFLSLTNLLQIVLILLSTLLGSYLLLQKRPLALAVFFIAFAIQNCCYLLSRAMPDISLPDLGAAFRFTYGATTYFTVREMLYRDFRYQWKHIWHAVPFVLAAMLPAFNLITQVPVILNISLGILLAVYLAASFIVLNHYEQVIADTRSEGRIQIAHGLRKVLYIYLALIVFEAGRFAIGKETNPQLYFILHYLFVSAASITLAILVVTGLRRPSLLPDISDDEIRLSSALQPASLLNTLQNEIAANEVTIDNIATDQVIRAEAGFTETPVNIHNDSREKRTIDMALDYRLKRLMLDDKPYLNPQLTVKELAEQLHAPARSVSELINSAYECNFSEFINKARVHEAQRLMQSTQWADQSLLDIALASGFNSKTSFNTMFRRYTDTTPSDYRRHLDKAIKH